MAQVGRINRQLGRFVMMLLLVGQMMLLGVTLRLLLGLLLLIL